MRVEEHGADIAEAQRLMCPQSLGDTRVTLNMELDGEIFALPIASKRVADKYKAGTVMPVIFIPEEFVAEDEESAVQHIIIADDDWQRDAARRAFHLRLYSLISALTFFIAIILIFKAM